MANKSLIDLTEKELKKALRSSIEYVTYSPADLREEIFRKSQDRNTKALNRWTIVMAIATLLNSIATCLLILRALGKL